MDSKPLVVRTNEAKGKGPSRPRPSPLNLRSGPNDPDLRSARSQHESPVYRRPSKRDFDPAFPYHIDEVNEIIYKLVDDEGEKAADDEEKEDEEEPRPPKKLVKRAAVPQTPGFCYDFVMSKIVADTKNPELKDELRRRMLRRESQDIDGPLRALMAARASHAPGTSGSTDGSGAIVKADGSIILSAHWDHLLQGVTQVARAMRARREWKMDGMKQAAGWCAWARERLIDNRTEFVADEQGGFLVERPLCEDSRPMEIKLGYRRREDCEWSGVPGPWDLTVHTEHDKAVMEWWDECDERK